MKCQKTSARFFFHATLAAISTFALVNPSRAGFMDIVDHAGGVISDTTKHAGKVVSDKTKRVGGDISKDAKHAGGVVSDESKKIGKKVSDKGKHLGGAAAKWSKEEYQKAAHAWTKLSKYGRERVFALLMESPRIISITVDEFGRKLSGEPVYYVNGMLTRHALAVQEATNLAGRLQRPVNLILNPTFLEGSTGTRTCSNDISEAEYDKMWRENLAAENPFSGTIVQAMSVGVLASSPSPPWAQLDTTTRQLTHLFYYAEKPISIVSHSQGCLQVNNALLAAGLLGHQGNVTNSIAWVATGTPVHESEIWPWPARYHRLVNNNDPVAVWIGTRGGPGAFQEKTFTDASNNHEPTTNYFPKITANMLFPSGSSQVPGPVGPAVVTGTHSQHFHPAKVNHEHRHEAARGNNDQTANIAHDDDAEMKREKLQKEIHELLNHGTMK